MDLELVNMLMTKRLVMERPVLSFYFLFNFISTLIVWGAAIVKFESNKYSLARLPFCIAITISFIFMMPLVIFSRSVELSLVNPWTYALIINGMALILMVWVYLSRHYDVVVEVAGSPTNVGILHVTAGIIGAILIGTYFTAVPLKCSGIYALFIDPTYTLLARELVVKLAGPSFSTYSLGAYANSVGPVFIFVSMWRMSTYFTDQKFGAGIICALFAFIAIAALLISGTKGLLMPTAIMLMITVYFYLKSWRSRFLGMAMTLIFFYFTLATFELLKDREAYVVRGQYDFASCALEIKACKEGLSLLESMKSSTYPLGLPLASVGVDQSRLACLCQGGDPQGCPSQKNNRGVSTNWAGVSPTSVNATSVNATSVSATPLSIEVLTRRLKSFTDAIFYRIFVVPFQVSIWHFMYAETEFVDGVKTLPFARRLTGDSLNMPELVYQKYGSIYWDGDKTTTSSAPTSFILTYTAYLGWFGFFIAVGCIVCLDLLIVGIIKILPKDLVPILIGVLVIMSINFSASDFVTVLVSHGGIAGLLVLLIYSVLLKIISKKSNEVIL